MKAFFNRIKITKLTDADQKFFLIFSLFWLIFGWLGFILTLSGFFYSWIFTAYSIASIIFFFALIKKRKISLKFSQEFILVSISIFIIVTFFSLFVTPTIFSGRDQGSISEAAIRLAQNHRLEFSTPESRQFFQIYGPGKALNFPGFYYTMEKSLISNFPIPYSSWLASFFSFYQLGGFILANSILLFLFLFSFYLLLRRFSSAGYAFLFLVLTATTFPIFWFYKFTLTENMALFLLWFSILSLLIYLKEKNCLSLCCLLASSSLLFFARIEGIILFFTLLTAFFIFGKNDFKKIIKNKVRIISLLSAFLLIIGWNLYKNIFYYKEIAKGIIQSNSFQKIGSLSFLGKIADEYLIFTLYGIIGLTIIGIIGIIYFIRKKDYEILVPLIVVFPTFIYLLNPWISGDHPWMLRRFAFSIIPAFIFYSAIFLKKWSEKSEFVYKKALLFAVVIILFIMNTPAFLKYSTFSENKDLINQVKKISYDFSEKDLILVDRLAGPDGWTMLAEPLSARYGKNAVYIFNNNDIEKIDFEKFDRVILLFPDFKSDYYKSVLNNFELKNLNKYRLETEKLVQDSKYAFPEKKKIIINLNSAEIIK